MFNEKSNNHTAGIPLAIAAQNPIISDQFTADPTARVLITRCISIPLTTSCRPKASDRTGSAWLTTTCSPQKT